MAEFCQQCAFRVWGFDTEDLARLSTPDDTADGRFCFALCEGCGPVLADHTGRRIHEPAATIDAGGEGAQPPLATGGAFEEGRDAVADHGVASYQAAKVFADGSTGLSWREAKGRKPVNAAETRTLYAVLWDEYIAENPALLRLIVEASGLQDMFGQSGHCCQATELWRIRCAAIAEGNAPCR